MKLYIEAAISIVSGRSQAVRMTSFGFLLQRCRLQPGKSGNGDRLCCHVGRDKRKRRCTQPTAKQASKIAQLYNRTAGSLWLGGQVER